MSKGILLLFFNIALLSGVAVCQTGEAPNYANSSTLPAGAAQASKITSNLVNLFTGQPTVSIPIYSFSNNSGLSTSVSLEYMGGGIQVGESPTTVGLGWYLSAGGCVTRVVRGMPDDMPTYGYLYASAIPTDWRSNANKYYHDSLDAQQDIFQYNFPGHSGKFFIGKNGQIVTVPLSRVRIIPTYQTATAYYQTLKSFRIIAEDGVKYDFEDADQTTVNIDGSGFPYGYSATASGYYGVPHATSWNLTRIIAAFAPDTIKFNYVSTGSGTFGYPLPQITFVNNSTGLRKNLPLSPGTSTSGFRKISSIELPDKTTVSFVYSYRVKYNSSDFALSKIQIKDTTLRFGYLLDYDTAYLTHPPGHMETNVYIPIKLMLKSVTPYTKYEKQEGYGFTYDDLFPEVGSPGDTLQSEKDYWGYFNNQPNLKDSLIPKINSYTWGADRQPTINAVRGVLSSFSLPTGGSIGYRYELNDHYPYIKQKNTVSITAETSSQNNVSLVQVYNNRHLLNFVVDKSIDRSGSSPISGPGNLNVYIKNTAGTTTYISTSISLNDLFYTGMRSIAFNLDTGTYRLETALSGGTSVSGSLPIDIKWENKKPNDTINYDYSGGIRVAGIWKQNSDEDIMGSSEEYKYIREDGKSSGFFGDIPTYDFQYRETVVNGSTTNTDYTSVCSEPLGSNGFVLGSPVGYSRVEVRRNTTFGNLGKEVQEFSDLKDVNTNAFEIAFPFTPQDYKAWGLGIPKRISVYDSSGTLVKRTVNTIQYDTVVYDNDNFKSIKLGHSKTTYLGDPNSGSTPKVKTFVGQEYFLTSGRAYVTNSKDSLFHSNASVSASYQNITYDTNYNVTKVTTSFDRTRGLEKEERMYYPYNYTLGGGIGTLRDSSIISLPISTETWITGDGNPRIVSGMATSFRAITNGDLKPDTIYSFESRKPILQGTIGVFDSSKLNRNTTYFKPQTYFTSYDSHGNLSEMKSLVSGLSNSVITDYDQQYAVAKISNAIQSDIAYTSFESSGSGNWTIGGSQRDVSDKLTGKKSYNLTNGSVSKSGLSTSQDYLLTFWAKSGASVSVNSGSPGSAIASQNGWNLYSVALSSISSVTISGSGLIDEIRLHPQNANMETYCFEPLIGVISSTDANNTVGYTEYDNLNRVKLIRDKDRNIIKRFDFSDTTMMVNTIPNWVGFDKVCSNTVTGGVDSVYRDTNLFSDSSGYVKHIYQGYLNCSCPDVVSNPQYAVINGNCEMGSWGVVSSVHMLVYLDGNWVWKWKCTYRFCFSDGSLSSFSDFIYYDSSCPFTCVDE